MYQNKTQPIINFTPYMTERTQDFTGRAWVFEIINDWLADPDSPPVFLLTGEPGSGKTAISARLTQFSTGTVSVNGFDQLSPDFLSAVHFCSARDRRWINPHTFTESLALQLAGRYPAFAKALAEKSGDRQTNIQVSQQAGTVSGQMAGVVINKLEVGSVSPEDAFIQVVREPLEVLLHQADVKQVVILVDALDETLQYSGQVGIVPLLAQAGNLPTGVRFILTSRDERSVLRHFEPLKPYILATEAQQNLIDIRHYITKRVKRETMQVRLQTASIEPHIFVGQVVELSKGNFLYTKILLDDIEVGQQPLNDPTALPQSLDEIYHSFLQRFTIVDWESRYQPILGTLAVTQEPITEKQLTNFTGIKRGKIRQNLGVMRQFLDVDEIDQGNKTYTLFHQSFRDYLLDEERNEDFWCSSEEEHQNIAKYYFENYQDRWPDCDHYGLRYLLTHLHDAQEWNMLVQMMTDMLFLETKANSYSIFSVLADFTLLKTFDKDLQNLEKGIRFQTHVLSLHPELFLPQLYSYLYGQYPDDKKIWTSRFDKAFKETRYLPQIWLKRLNHCSGRVNESLIMTIEGHSDEVTSVSFSPDGNQIVSSSSDGTTKIWDAHTGEQLQTFGQDSGKIALAVILPEQNFMILSENDEINLYDTKTNQVTKLCRVPHKVTALAYAPYNKQIASGGANGEIRLWNGQNGQEIGSFSGHSQPISFVAFSPDEKLLVSLGNDDNRIKLYDIETAMVKEEFLGQDLIEAAVFSPDSNQLIWADIEDDAGFFVSVIRIFDLNKWQEIKTFYDYYWVHSLDISPDGKQIVSAATDGIVKLWNIEETKEWDIGKAKSVKKFTGHYHQVYAVAMAPDGKKLVSGDREGSLKLWDLEVDNSSQMRGHESNISAAAFSPTGETVISTDRKGRVKCWHVGTGQEEKEFTEKIRIRSEITNLSFSPDGNQVAFASRGEQEIKLLNLRQDHKIKSLKQKAVEFHSVLFSPDGKKLAAGTQRPHKEVILWDLNRGGRLNNLSSKNHPSIYAPLRSALLRMIFLASRVALSIARGASLNSRTQVNTFHVHENNPITSLAFSPDGKQLAASTGWAGTTEITIWDIDSGAEIRSFTGPFGYHNPVAFLPSGNYLLTAGGDSEIRLWDLATGENKKIFTGHTLSVDTIDVSPDGKQFISGSYDQSIKLWDIETGTALATYFAEAPIKSVRFSPDGKEIWAIDNHQLPRIYRFLIIS